ncbi:hypothetical protein [Prauserella rugosa]|uniref:Uncharacterized protein n=1 Tax=Prauserella rugosa TaxID=43354 RepID=A0A660CBZ8_9PSEU|nr:hypothetical protein [Prauserella rugosa]KMS88989.1 hypothetical protein ACZ91_22755 [Streptomyces regensis]TWH21110.1 hypothetical protein JD82_02964 [Prauserella rugosa]
MYATVLHRRWDGTLVMVGPDGWPIEADPDSPDLDVVPGWLPVVSGVRHIGGTPEVPTGGTTVEALCGRPITVPRRQRRRHRRPALFDCHACWHVWLGFE